MKTTARKVLMALSLPVFAVGAFSGRFLEFKGGLGVSDTGFFVPALLGVFGVCPGRRGSFRG
jgi:hypothetical protein